MGMQSIGSLIDKDRRSVVLEGISDHYYFYAFQKLLNKDKSLFFVPSCGVNNVPNVVSVLIGWRCQYAAVFDDDPGSGRTAYRLLKSKFYEDSDAEAQKYIKKIKGCNGIEDMLSKKDFRKLVLEEETPITRGIKNSEVAEGKKELLARLFLDKVDKGEIAVAMLSKKTKKSFEDIFDWIYKVFKIEG